MKCGIQMIYNINLYKFCSYKLVEVLLLVSIGQPIHTIKLIL